MDVTTRRLLAQGLIEPAAATPGQVVETLLAVQAQDGRGARLAIRPRLSERVTEPSASMVDAALDEGSLVVNWLNRGTLHLVRAEDHGWLHALTAPRQATANQTRLRQEGVSEKQADRGVGMIVDRLKDGPATRGELKEVLAAEGVPVAGQALVHILLFASLQGLILRGPTLGGEHAFVLVEDWLGPQGEVDLELAAAELARRYLTGHGPATDRDLAKWAGVNLSLARKGLAAISGETVEADGRLELKERPSSTVAEAPVRLLGAFDPVLHGWTDRAWILPDEATRKVVTTNGIFRPTILAGDRIVGTWTMPSGRVELAPFGKLDRKTVAALEVEAERVRRYLG